MSRVARILACFLVASALAGALTGCGDTFPRLPEFRSGAPAVIDPPGIYDAPRGSVRALGVLDLVSQPPMAAEGRWALVGVASGTSAESVVVALIANPDELDVDPATLRGRYVEVTGTLVEWSSPSALGPEIVVRSIRMIEADVSE